MPETIHNNEHNVKVDVSNDELYSLNILDHLKNIIILLSPAGIIQVVNRTACNILGYKCEELIGQLPDKILTNEKGMKWSRVEELLDNGKMNESDMVLITKSGGRMNVSVSLSAIYDESNNIQSILCDGHNFCEDTRQELVDKHEELNRVFRQVEIAKKEWEKTLDCAGDMIILTDSDGIIKRTNRAVKDFTGMPFTEILGRTWEDLIVENDLEAMTLYVESTELLHRPTQRWFELNAYPFDDSELEYSGSVLVIHETTEIRQVTEKLENTGKSVERQRDNLQKALNEICILMQNVIKDKHSGLQLTNPHLKKCYEIKDCNKDDCSCYGKDAMRCWQVAGTFCGDDVQGTFAQKYVSCSECSVYKIATKDPINQISEHFNNMIHLLEHSSKR